MKFEQHKDTIIRLLLWLLMLLSLIASMRHVAWLFSTIELMDYASGWIAAVGFDFGIFLLTLIAHKYKEGSPQRRFIRAGIYTNAVLSAMANVMYGVEHQVPLERVSGLLWLLIPYVFALALPIMVVFLAEVLSREEENESRAFDKQQKKLAKSVTELSHPVSQSVTQSVPAAAQLVLAQVAQGVTSHRKIAGLTGLQRGQVGRAIQVLVAQGQLEKDSKGQARLPQRDTAETVGRDTAVTIQGFNYER